MLPFDDHGRWGQLASSSISMEMLFSLYVLALSLLLYADNIMYVICNFAEIWDSHSDTTGSTILTYYDVSIELMSAKGISSLENYRYHEYPDLVFSKFHDIIGLPFLYTLHLE